MQFSKVVMAMQWYFRTKSRSHRPVKFSVGRCITLSTFIIFMCLLYFRFGGDQKTIQGPSVVSVMDQADRQVENTPVSAHTQETDTFVTESAFYAPETRVTFATSEVPVPEVTSATLSEVSDLEVVSANPVVPDPVVPFSSSEVPAPEVSSASPELSDTAVRSASADAPDQGAESEDFQRAGNCEGRRIYLYQLPVEFNEQLARNCHNWTDWIDMCQDISNFGFGMPIRLPESDPMASVLRPPSAWFRTDQFTLEISFHERLKTHKCRTENPDEASLFYIPFYHTLDLIRFLYQTENITERDRLGLQLVEWLKTQEPWQRYHGHRHVLVLGRIYWDFIRGTGRDDKWGSNLLTQVELRNVTKLFIERSPWQSDTVGIPYPTSFHPASDADLRQWQHTVRNSKRRKLASVAGGTRTKKLTGSIRDKVFNQCANSTKCNQVVCTHDLCVRRPQTIIQMSLESVFCLQPPGDSPTRKGIFDSLITGCIPVLFNEQQAVKQYLFHLPGNGLSYSVMIPEEDVTENNYDIMAHLSKIPREKIKKMQENIIQLLPRLLYRSPVLTGEYTSKDAIDVAIDGLLDRFRLQSEGEHPSS